eukprot:304983-Prymnesium_polylepis.1
MAQLRRACGQGTGQDADGRVANIRLCKQLDRAVAKGRVLKPERAESSAATRCNEHSEGDDVARCEPLHREVEVLQGRSTQQTSSRKHKLKWARSPDWTVDSCNGSQSSDVAERTVPSPPLQQPLLASRASSTAVACSCDASSSDGGRSSAARSREAVQTRLASAGRGADEPTSRRRSAGRLANSRGSAGRLTSDRGSAGRLASSAAGWSAIFSPLGLTIVSVRPVRNLRSTQAPDQLNQLRALASAPRGQPFLI